MSKREEKCPGCGTRDLTCGERDAGICYDCRRWVRQKNELRRQLADVKAEVGRLKETNRRLNRRCQTYEAALAEKIEKARAEYRNLGRMLANAAAEMAQAEVKRLNSCPWCGGELERIPTDGGDELACTNPACLSAGYGVWCYADHLRAEVERLSENLTRLRRPSRN